MSFFYTSELFLERRDRLLSFLDGLKSSRDEPLDDKRYELEPLGPESLLDLK